MSEKLLIPIYANTTTGDLLDALISADVGDMLFPPGTRSEDIVAVRLQNEERLDRQATLAHYNLRSSETIEIRFIAQRLLPPRNRSDVVFAPVETGEAWVCPACGHDLMPHANFCDECGALIRKVEERARGYLVLKHTGVQIPLPADQGEVIIGRRDPVSGDAPDIDLLDWNAHAFISRRHARILIRDDRVLIEDLNSTNHTFVNGQRLLPYQPRPLTHGMEIRLAGIELTFLATLNHSIPGQ
jgi:hypothetical protein